MFIIIKSLSPKKTMRLALVAVALVLGGLLLFQFKMEYFPNMVKSEHFVYYYTDTDKESIKDIEQRLEANYERIVQDLQPQDMPVIQVRIYPDLSSFHNSLDQPKVEAWVVGVATKDEIKMVSPVASGLSLSYENIMQVVVHELTHSVVGNIMGYTSPSWNWLNESIAVYEAGQFRDPSQSSLISKDHAPTLNDLRQNVKTVYELGYTMTEYIKDTWGLKGLRELVLSNGSTSQAFQISEEDFIKGWHSYVVQKYLK